MSDIDAFKQAIQSEVDAARKQVETLQEQAARHYEQLQERYRTFLEISGQIREALRPRIEAFAEALPGISPTVGHRDFGPAGRGFHGAYVAFDLPKTDDRPASLHLRFGLDAGPGVESVILDYDLEINPVFIEFQRHDRIVLPLDPSSVDRAVAWFEERAIEFTKTYINIFFNKHYRRGSEVSDVVLGTTFPVRFAKGQVEHNGVTYHFFTEESKALFEQDPSRFLHAPASG